jgi:hypothetical protein
VNWLYNGELFESKDIPEGCIGFVYCVTNKETGLKYIGKKLFYRTIKRPPLKGKTRKRKEVVESDWKTYCGSSEEVKSLVEEKGLDSFKREILHFCFSKGELTYMEMKEQITRDVLLKPDEYYNAYVGGRINRMHLSRLLNKK